MPFMKGLQAFRNTQKYLEQGHIVFKHNVKVMMINYNTPKIQPGRTDSSVGIRDMVFWSLNQIQYKNPHTQILTFKDMTPSPFISFILANGRKMHIDVDGQSKEDILSHIRQVLGKTDEELKEEEVLVDQAMFGYGSARHCICEVPGQVPCPGFVPLPREMTGKYKVAKLRGELEEEM